MSGSVITTPIPLKGQPGFMLPEDGGIAIVDSVVRGRSMTSFYQALYGVDEVIDLPAGKTEMNFISFVAEQFQLQGVELGSCEKLESHGGFKSGNGKLSTCPVAHYSTFCPQGNLVGCHQHLINPYSDEHMDVDQLNLVEIQMKTLASQVMNGVRDHLTLGKTYFLDADGDVANKAGKVEKPATVSNEKWDSFKRELTVNCRGWLDYVTEFCNIFNNYKEQLKKCKSAADRTEIYDDIFEQLRCCAEKLPELREALDGNLQGMNAMDLMPYIRVSRSIWSDIHAVVRRNKAQQDNGCTNVCNSFTYEMVTFNDRNKAVIYWNGYMLVVDDGLCAWDNMLGGTTYAAFFTVEKNIQITAGYEYIDEDMVPIDYLQGQRQGDYNRPVLAVQKKSQSINCKEWEAKMTMRIGAGVCSPELIAGDYCVIK